MTESPIKVLVVDDDPFVQSSAHEFIEAATDLTCVGRCSDGAQAVAFVRETPVDVVLMDVQMPVMDGVTAARLILAEHPAVRVLMWTAFGDDSAVTTAMGFGASGFLLKTCTVKTLVSAVRAAASGTIVMLPDTFKAMAPAPSVTLGALPELTAREEEVLRALCLGMSNAEMGVQLFMSESAVKAHLTSIMAKFCVCTRLKLVVEALKHGF